MNTHSLSGGSSAAYREVFAAAERLLGQKPYIVMAVDGRCGSGKTWLAQQLAQHFGGRIVHTDDFYLPFEARHRDWENTAGGNMDFERLLREAVLPASQGRVILYRPFRCHEKQEAQEIVLPPAALTIVEGSYSAHPLLAGCYDFKLFLTCPDGVQRQRLRAREGENYPNFEARWIPMEERYFAECRIRENCGLELDTGELF